MTTQAYHMGRTLELQINETECGGFEAHCNGNSYQARNMDGLIANLLAQNIRTRERMESGIYYIPCN